MAPIHSDIDLNINLFLVLNYGMDSELKIQCMKLCGAFNVFVPFLGLNKNTGYYTHYIGFGSFSSLTDTCSAENGSIGADTDTEYRIDASLSWCAASSPLWLTNMAFLLLFLKHLMQ